MQHAGVGGGALSEQKTETSVRLSRHTDNPDNNERHVWWGTQTASAVINTTHHHYTTTRSHLQVFRRRLTLIHPLYYLKTTGDIILSIILCQISLLIPNLKPHRDRWHVMMSSVKGILHPEMIVLWSFTRTCVTWGRRMQTFLKNDWAHWVLLYWQKNETCYCKNITQNMTVTTLALGEAKARTQNRVTNTNKVY